MKPVRALFLDLNATLLDGSGGQEAIIGTCREIAAQTGLDAARLYEANSEIWQAYWPQVEEQWTLGRLSGAAVSLEAWRRTLGTCGYDESLAPLARATLARNMPVRLFDDVHDVLGGLGTRLPIALVTNGAADTQREALGVVGIEHYFAAVVISGEVGLAKPDPAIFRVALEEVRLEPEGVWHVGDSLITDVAGAKAAGLTAVWLNRRGLLRKEGDPEPDLEISSLKELPALLETAGR